MKFTKEEAYKQLVGKIPNKGQTLNLSERSINETLESLMPLLATEETELEDFVAKVLPIFKTTDGNVQHDVSEGIKTYKANNPKPTDVKPTESKETEVTDVNKAILERLEALEKRNAELAKSASLDQRKKDIIAKLNEKGCKDNKWIESLLDEVNLDGEDFDVEAKCDKYLTMYNKKNAKTPKDVTPDNTNGGVDKDYLNSVLKVAGEKAKESV